MDARQQIWMPLAKHVFAS